MSTATETADKPPIERIGEVDIAARRGGTVRSARMVSVVRHSDAAYVRSVSGHDSA